MAIKWITLFGLLATAGHLFILVLFLEYCSWVDDEKEKARKEIESMKRRLKQDAELQAVKKWLEKEE